jgi:hypothetical protein
MPTVGRVSTLRSCADGRAYRWHAWLTPSWAQAHLPRWPVLCGHLASVYLLALDAPAHRIHRDAQTRGGLGQAEPLTLRTLRMPRVSMHRRAYGWLV